MSIKMRDLLVEIGTEELPPKVLQKLSQSFSDFLVKDLDNDALLEDNSITESYTSPRRLSLLISKVRECAPDRPFEEKGPSVKVGVDKNNNPTKALIGFANKWDVDISQLERQETPKGEFFFYKHIASGSNLKTSLDLKIESALKQLPIPKRMRWGEYKYEFVRPVHWIVVLFGNEVIDCEILGVQSGRNTYGHRYHHPEPIKLKSPSDYVQTLRTAKVWLNDQKANLCQEISKQTISLANEIKGSALNCEPESNLVAEIAALVEWPVGICGAFDPKFLTLPEEVLIATLENQQRYFPIRDKKTGKLLPYFVTIANIESKNIDQVRHGNERVIVPRLVDAMFFWDTDRATTLESRISELDGIVFQNKLGSIGDKIRRVAKLAESIAKSIGGDPELATRAALLAKCDLVTNLVGEFPELQGTIGRYLAQHDGEPDEVAKAIEEHYLPRFAGDRLPETRTGQALAIADKLDSIAGIFGIGQAPTGDKDPFGIRRAALGIVRILTEQQCPLSLFDTVNAAFKGYDGKIGDSHSDLETFIFERARNYFIDKNFTPNEVESVLCMRPARLDIVPAQLEAVRKYNKLPEAPSLSAANKRIGNILKGLDSQPSGFDSSLLVETAEKQLASAYLKIEPEIDSLFKERDFTSMLQKLAALKEPVDTFFDKVMVMTDDQKLKNNRIGLLNKLHKMMNRIADLSRLAA
jgi:glycyl-tRNA synthetase beta chain